MINKTRNKSRSKKIIVLSLVALAIVFIYCIKSFAHDRYLTNLNFKNNQIVYIKEGTASWYGKRFHGRKTACGERYDMFGLTAAHRKLPLGSVVKVTNLNNNKHVIVRINDRGPYFGNRLIDLSLAAACELRMVKKGVSKVKIEVLSWGS